jgi:hypothetical protein
MDKLKYDLAYALSDQDIRRLNPRTKLILYEDVKKYKNIDQLLSPFDSVIILYEWQRTKDASVGHYITVNRVNDGIVEHFDSYAIKPDNELKQLKDASTAFKKMTGQDHKYLLDLYIKSPHQISYNHYPLQSLSDDISTCGRFCVIRSLYRRLPLEEFAKFFINKRGTPDEIAVELTQPLLK